MALGAADHPWLVPPKGALAGSAAHIALLAAAESVTRSRDARVARADISPLIAQPVARSEEHTSELQSLMRISYAVFCLKKKNHITRSPQPPLARGSSTQKPKHIHSQIT